MKNREIEENVLELVSYYPVVAITGPRQSGKTTLAKKLFKDYKYYNLEDPYLLEKIRSDPKSFINTDSSKIIIDEIQKMPELMSLLQVIVDEQKKPGNFIISGSENLLLSEKLTQSLAGRAAYITLLPFSYREINRSDSIYEVMYKGAFPDIYEKNIPPKIFYPQYISTYVERDVKQIVNISNLGLFRKFLILLAARTGQIIDYSSLANDVGVTSTTINSWISILETSYLIIKLQPYYENLGKRVIKSPKLYFTDTGILCSLLGIKSPEELFSHYLIGSIFENFIIIEKYKKILNYNAQSKLYFYRDSNRNEIDLIVDSGIEKELIEIKSSSTFSKVLLQL